MTGRQRRARGGASAGHVRILGIPSYEGDACGTCPALRGQFRNAPVSRFISGVTRPVSTFSNRFTGIGSSSIASTTGRLQIPEADFEVTCFGQPAQQLAADAGCLPQGGTVRHSGTGSGLPDSTDDRSPTTGAVRRERKRFRQKRGEERRRAVADAVVVSQPDHAQRHRLDRLRPVRRPDLRLLVHLSTNSGFADSLKVSLRCTVLCDTPIPSAMLPTDQRVASQP